MRRRHRGALVAVHVGASVLLLRSSYRAAWNFPSGGVKQGETPEAAARRELAEEIGLSVTEPLQPLGTASGVWEGRDDTVFFFALHLDVLPAVRLDRREIIGARLVPAASLGDMKLTGPVRAYAAGRLSRI